MKNLMLILFSVCLTVAQSAEAQKVGLLLDSYVIDRWYIDQRFFTERVKELGGECTVEVAHGDAAEQIRQAKKLIAAGMDVLAIVAVDAQKAIEIVEAAAAAKIPILAYDRLINSKYLSFYISYNNVKVGRLQAQYALNKVPKGNYILINGPVSDNNSAFFKNGQRSVLQSAINTGKINILADLQLDGWSEIEALMKVDELLTYSNQKPDVILAANDAIATGAIQSLPKDLLGKVVITGQDADLTAIKNIIAGNQSMTIYKPIKPLAVQAAEIAIKLAKGEKVHTAIQIKTGESDIDAILLDPVVVDKSNYKETVIKDGHINLPEIIEK